MHFSQPFAQNYSFVIFLFTFKYKLEKVYPHVLRNHETAIGWRSKNNVEDNSLEWSITTHAQFEEENHFDDLKKFLFLLSTEEHQTHLENYVKIFFSHEEWNTAKLNAIMKKTIQSPDPERSEENEKQIVQILAKLSSQNVKCLDQNIKM